MSGRRTLKANMGRKCTMCQEDPRLFGKTRPERMPMYSKRIIGDRLMICPIHDRASVRISK